MTTRVAEYKFTDEQWANVKGYEGLYSVSNLGRIKSHAKMRNKRFEGEKILNQNGRRYLQVNLSKDGKVTKKLVHRLVAIAFMGESNLQVNHIDGNKLNNKIDNLEYCTQRENTIHAYKNNLIKHWSVKIICINDKRVFDSIKLASLFYNIATYNISNVLRGKTPHYKNYKFEYLEV